MREFLTVITIRLMYTFFRLFLLVSVQLDSRMVLLINLFEDLILLFVILFFSLIAVPKYEQSIKLFQLMWPKFLLRRRLEYAFPFVKYSKIKINFVVFKLSYVALAQMFIKACLRHFNLASKFQINLRTQATYIEHALYFHLFVYLNKCTKAIAFPCFFFRFHHNTKKRYKTKYKEVNFSIMFEETFRRI